MRCTTASLLPVFAVFILAASGCIVTLDDVVDPEIESQAEQERTVAATNRVCAGPNTVEGVDVSYWDPNVDWQKVKSSGREFAFARISYGHQFLDSEFDRNWEAIKAAGLIRGIYQYYRPSQDAQMQADVIVNKVGLLGPGDLPVVLDIETTEGYSNAYIAKGLRIWVKRVAQGTGKQPIIYTAWGIWGTLGNPTQDFDGLPLWVAHYTKACPLTPETWKNWAFWQYSENGIVPGIPGSADVNVFNGTLAQLKAFAGLAGGSTPPLPSNAPPPANPPANPPTSNCHAGMLFGWLYCSTTCPCDEGQGDCDKDNECAVGLICAMDKGASFGTLSTVDVCEKPPTGTSNSCHEGNLFGWLYCSDTCPCSAGEGDCDEDSECAAGLVCAHNVGTKYGAPALVDICQAK